MNTLPIQDKEQNNMKLSLDYPVKPYHQNQPFGANPDYYAKFLDRFGNPEKGHMGEDLQAGHGQPVYSPADGQAFYVQDEHGGDGLYLRVNDSYNYNNSQAYFTVILWHLCSKDDPQFKPLIPCDGNTYPVKAGDLIAYADNTGAPFESSGDHLHVGLIPGDITYAPLEPQNGFGGCIDPNPYWSGYYAEDITKMKTILGLYQKVVQYLQKLWTLKRGI